MNASIRSRLIVLVLAAVLPVLFVAAWFLWEGVQADYGKARIAATSAAQLAAARIDDHVNDVKSLLTVLGRMVSFDPADAENNESAGLPPGSAVRITNEQGIIVAGPDNPDWTGRDVSDNPIVRRHIEIGEASEEAVWLDGVTRITASVKMRAVPWVVTVGLPVDATFAAAHEEVRWELFMSALAVAAAFLLAWRLSSGIAGPIRQLQHAAAGVGAGKLDHRARMWSTG